MRSVPPVTHATPCGLFGQLRLLSSNDSSRRVRGPAGVGTTVGAAGGALVGTTRAAAVGAGAGASAAPVAPTAPVAPVAPVAGAAASAATVGLGAGSSDTGVPAITALALGSDDRSTPCSSVNR